MGFQMPHIIVVIAIAVIGVALLFQVIGLATMGWIVIDGTEVKQGLWKGCIASGICGDLVNLPAYLEACRAFSILGMLAMAASLGCGALLCFLPDLKVFSILAPLAAGAGAFCAMIEFAVYAGERSDYSEYFGYSFALTIVACILSVAAAVLFFVGFTRSAPAAA